jgi:hypothetical protein
VADLLLHEEPVEAVLDEMSDECRNARAVNRSARPARRAAWLKQHAINAARSSALPVPLATTRRWPVGGITATPH